MRGARGGPVEIASDMASIEIIALTGQDCLFRIKDDFADIWLKFFFHYFISPFLEIISSMVYIL